MLQRTHRFHGYNSLNFVYRHGATVRGPDMSVRSIVNNKRQTYRVAVVVGKKTHKSAVVRNRIRRRVFECVRTLAPLISDPIDIVVTIHTENVASLPHSELEKEVKQLFEQARITKHRPASHK